MATVSILAKADEKRCAEIFTIVCLKQLGNVHQELYLLNIYTL